MRDEVGPMPDTPTADDQQRQAILEAHLAWAKGKEEIPGSALNDGAPLHPETPADPWFMCTGCNSRRPKSEWPRWRGEIECFTCLHKGHPHDLRRMDAPSPY